MNTFKRQNRLIVALFQAGLALVYLIGLPTLCGAADPALRQYQKGNYPEAIRTYDRILKDHNDWEEAHFGKGAALYKSQRTDEALQEFEKALAVKDPVKKSAVFYNLGNSLYQSGRAEESLAFYKKALELNPRDYDAKYNYELARLMMQQQKSQQDKQNQKDQKQQDQKDKQKDQSDDQPQDQKQQQNQAQQQAQKSRQEKEKSQKEAAQVLDALKNDEKQLMQERRQMKASGLTKEK
ncbi:MAG: tetratricopeptide repeat protein, partial [Candidatus Neomarinimicrobiota bacterium]